VSTHFLVSNLFLLAAQAVLVGLAGAGVPRWLARFGGVGWALVLPLNIAVVVAAIALVPDVAVALSWLALTAIPPLAAAALGWAMRGAVPALGLLAAPLLAIGWAAQDTLGGDLALSALTALSCVTLGRLMTGVVPLLWLEVGIVAMAVVDSILVFGHQLQAPNEVLNTAVPAAGLPQLQYLSMPYATLGYGDVLVAGVLGAILAARGERQWPVAVLVLGLAVAWDTMFWVVDTVPATVPVAAALLIVRLARGTGGREAPSSRRSASAGDTPIASSVRAAPPRSSRSAARSR
jgi:hypothetical protein